MLPLLARLLERPRRSLRGLCLRALRAGQRSYNIWYYERGGKEMFDELYGRFGLGAFFCGNVGQELGLHSNKRATKLEDFKGMKIAPPAGTWTS